MGSTLSKAWRFDDIIETLEERCARYADTILPPEDCLCDRCQAVHEIKKLRRLLFYEKHVPDGISVTEVSEEDIEEMPEEVRKQIEESEIALSANKYKTFTSGWKASQEIFDGEKPDD